MTMTVQTQITTAALPPVSEMQRTASPPFTALGITFTAYAMQEGDLPGSARVVWLSDCGRIRCGGLVLPRTPVLTDPDQRTRRVVYWARIDGALIGAEFLSLRSAMEQAGLKAGRRAAR